MYMAEVGKNGWHAMCKTLTEARKAIRKRQTDLMRRFDDTSEIQKLAGSKEAEDVYRQAIEANSQYGIWQDGIFIEGEWPTSRR